MITQSTFDFLKTLSINNNREWFTLHKKEYENAQKELTMLTAKIISGISGFDESVAGLNPKDCLFRIYKDIRFSKDKTPYKTNLGSFISKGGRKSLLTGYYVHIEPGNCFISGGIYMPLPEHLKAIREEIFYNYQNFSQIVENSGFKELFNTLWGEKLSRPPKGFPADFKGIEYLKLKSFVSMHEVPDKKVADPEYYNYAVRVLKETYPLNIFLNKAIGI